jgi:hypothetical protein
MPVEVVKVVKAVVSAADHDTPKDYRSPKRAYN